jgi:hypothetical protein
MDIFFSFSLDHAREEMLEYLYIFAMHTDEKGTIRGLYSYIDIISYDVDSETRDHYTQPRPKVCDKRMNSIFHKFKMRAKYGKSI